jgi:hypothetical protein
MVSDVDAGNFNVFERPVIGWLWQVGEAWAMDEPISISFG